MGRGQVQRPLLGVQEDHSWDAPRGEGRQQTLGPASRFELARRFGRGLSEAASLAARGGGALAFGFVRGDGPGVSTSLHPFAPPALPGFLATMGALTPARRLFVSLSGTMNSAWARAGLPVFGRRTFRSFRLQPPTVVPTRFWGFFAPSLPGHAAVAACLQASASFGLRHSLAGSPRRSAESSSLALRTGRSPRVALHPASRRRSYLRLRGSRKPRQGLAPC
jgi:hypothetical protein